MVSRVTILIALFAGVVISIILLGADPSPESLVEQHHRGVNLIEQHRFTEAEKVLLGVVEAVPTEFVPRFNLGVAQLNQAEAGADRAIVTFQEARELSPFDPHVPYYLGIAYRFVGNETAAKEEFQKTVELAPNDADANYNVGISLLHSDQRSQALPYFELALRLDPTLLGASNNLQLLYRRAGRTEDAERILEHDKAMRASGQGRAQSYKYTEQGKLSRSMRDWNLPLPAVEGALSISFETPLELGFPVISPDTAHALVDLDLDCVPDLWIAGPEGKIWSFGIGGAGTPMVHEAPAPLLEATTFCVGDVNEDGLPDVITAGAGEIRIFSAQGVPVPTFELLETLPIPELGAIAELRLVDLDLEGDLDLLIIPERGAPQIALNEGRVFRAPGTPALPEMGEGPVRLLTAHSIDSDIDADLVFAGKSAPYLRAVRNAPEWDFEANPESWAPPAATAGESQSVVADFTGDARDDLLVAMMRDGQVWIGIGRGAGDFFADLADGGTIPAGRLFGLTVADFDLDGALDLAVIGQTGHPNNFDELPGERAIWILRNDGAGKFEVVRTVPVVAETIIAGDVDDDFDPDLIAISTSGMPTFLRNATNPLSSAAQFHALRLYFGGKRDGDDRRSNQLGYGVRVETRAGDLTVGRTFQGSIGHRAQGVAPMTVGLAGRDAVSWVYLLWPDGVSQAEDELPLDSCHVIEEVQRKASSCPVLFTWDGSEYRFITDFMGGGGLGFWIGPGEFAPPEPTEVVRIPPDALLPIDGELRLSVMEPMQESCTIDRLELIAVDHPAGTEVYPFEYFPVLGEAPSGAALLVEESARRFPIAIEDRGGSLDPQVVATVDRRYAGPRALDPDLVGYAESQEWIVDFGEAGAKGTTHLFLDGWVEYPYSRINFSAWQRDDRRARRLEAPSFWWDRGDGDWQLLGTEIGYPAGMPKTMVLDVNEVIGRGATRFKIASNLELYWDRLFLAPVVEVAASAQHVVPPKSAELRFGGYPREYSDDGMLPLTYHYAEREADLGYEPMGGLFTKYGRVDPLLETVDDQFVVMGGGDEIDLVYDATALPPLGEGTLRTYLLDTHGYCKDRDPLTATPDSVEPLPFSTMTAYPPAPTDVEPERAAYRAKWNTRRDGGGRGVREARPVGGEGAQ